jgi:hypothetical protein
MAIKSQPESAAAQQRAAIAPIEDRPLGKGAANGAAAPEPSDKLGAAGEPAGDVAAIAEQQGVAESPETAGRNPVDDAIRLRAYEIWESEGRPEGRQHEHWSRAEGELGRGERQGG